MEGKKKQPTHILKEWNIMIDTFKTFRDTTDTNHFIPYNYVIPFIATFSSHLHGIKLGSFLNRVRQTYHANRLTPCQIETLEKYHIHWDYESYKLQFVSLPSLNTVSLFSVKYNTQRKHIGLYFTTSKY